MAEPLTSKALPALIDGLNVVKVNVESMYTDVIEHAQDRLAELVAEAEPRRWRLTSEEDPPKSGAYFVTLEREGKRWWSTRQWSPAREGVPSTWLCDPNVNVIAFLLNPSIYEGD